jgi:hypothetical protein
MQTPNGSNAPWRALDDNKAFATWQEVGRKEEIKATMREMLALWQKFQMAV